MAVSHASRSVLPHAQHMRTLLPRSSSSGVHLDSYPECNLRSIELPAAPIPSENRVKPHLPLLLYVSAEAVWATPLIKTSEKKNATIQFEMKV
jgi:hypothetical protein